MTDDRFERRLGDLFATIGPADAADLVADVVTSTAAMRQRRGVAVRLAGIRAGATTTWAYRSPAIRAVLLALLLVLLAAAVAVVGSRLLERRPFDSNKGFFITLDPVPDRMDIAGVDVLPDARVMFEGPQWDHTSVTGTNWIGWVVKIWDPGTNRFMSFPRAIRPPRPPDAVPSSKPIDRVIPLLDGRILVIDGWDGPLGPATTAELLDIGAGTYSTAGSMTTARLSSSAIRLLDGRVLVTGGEGREKDDLPPDTTNGEPAMAGAEIFDPSTGSFSAAGSMAAGRVGHQSVLLADGRVLIVGGLTGSEQRSQFLSSAELFDPATGTFTPTGAMLRPRGYFAVQPVRLADGRVLLIGGGVDEGQSTFDPVAQIVRNGPISTEIYDPATGRFVAGPFLPAIPTTATLLDDGLILVTGIWLESHQKAPMVPSVQREQRNRSWAGLVDLRAGTVSEIAPPAGATASSGTPLAHALRLFDGRLVYVEGWDANDQTDPEGTMAIFTEGPRS